MHRCTKTNGLQGSDSPHESTVNNYHQLLIGKEHQRYVETKWTNHYKMQGRNLRSATASVDAGVSLRRCELRMKCSRNCWFLSAWTSRLCPWLALHMFNTVAINHTWSMHMQSCSENFYQYLVNTAHVSGSENRFWKVQAQSIWSIFTDIFLHI